MQTRRRLSPVSRGGCAALEWYEHNGYGMEDDPQSTSSGGDAEAATPPPEGDADGAVDALGAVGARWERAAEHFVGWRDGDPRAIDELVRIMTPVLWQVVRAYGLRASLAEDVIQTTWLTLVRKHASIERPQAVSGWLTITARREAWRVSKRDHRADPTEADQLDRITPPQRAVDDDVSESDERDRLWQAVEQLDDRCQRLLRIVAFDDRPDYAEISQALGMPIGSIGPTRKRCLAKLRRLLDTDTQRDHGGGRHG